MRAARWRTGGSDARESRQRIRRRIDDEGQGIGEAIVSRARGRIDSDDGSYAGLGDKRCGNSSSFIQDVSTAIECGGGFEGFSIPFDDSFCHEPAAIHGHDKVSTAGARLAR